MDTRKWKPFTRSDKTDKIANNDAHIGTCFDLPAQLRIAQSTLNTNVGGRGKYEASGRRYLMCG